MGIHSPTTAALLIQVRRIALEKKQAFLIVSWARNVTLVPVTLD
jgi:hypothetical protein